MNDDCSPCINILPCCSHPFNFTQLFPNSQGLAGDLGVTNSSKQWGKGITEPSLHPHRGVAFSLTRQAKGKVLSGGALSSLLKSYFKVNTNQTSSQLCPPCPDKLQKPLFFKAQCYQPAAAGAVSNVFHARHRQFSKRKNTSLRGQDVKGQNCWFQKTLWTSWSKREKKQNCRKVQGQVHGRQAETCTDSTGEQDCSCNHVLKTSAERSVQESEAQLCWEGQSSEH